MTKTKIKNSYGRISTQTKHVTTAKIKTNNKLPFSFSHFSLRVAGTNATLLGPTTQTAFSTKILDLVRGRLTDLCPLTINFRI